AIAGTRARLSAVTSRSGTRRVVAGRVAGVREAIAHGCAEPAPAPPALRYPSDADWSAARPQGRGAEQVGSPVAGAVGQAAAPAGSRDGRVREGGGDGRRRVARRGGLADDGEQALPRAFFGRRGARPGRPNRRVQLPGRVEHGLAVGAECLIATLVNEFCA